MGVGAIDSGRSARVWQRLSLAPDDLLRDRVYRRLWLSILTAAFANQVMLLALPLTAAVLLHASPTEMGLLTAAELTPFVLLSLPSGVWLDRVRKLPVYLIGEALIALASASVPLAAWLGHLSMAWLYGVGLLLGAVHTVSGSAAQIVLTQVVGRERLVQAQGVVARGQGHRRCAVEVVVLGGEGQHVGGFGAVAPLAVQRGDRGVLGEQQPEAVGRGCELGR